MGDGIKVLIAHPAQQHSFRTAAALKNAGYLFKYVTTVYDKEHSLTSLVKKFLRGDNLTRANTRKSVELENEQIVQFCEFESLILLFLRRIDKKKLFYYRFHRIILGLFNRRVVRYAINHKVDAVIMYDTLSNKALEILKRKAPNIKRIIDMSAPNLSYMNAIYTEDLKKNGRYIDTLKKEIHSSNYIKTLSDSRREIELAQYFLVASTFSEISLNYSGVSSDRIFKCTYGIDSNFFSVIKGTDNKKGKLNCLFIGKVSQKKGAFYLFDAIRKVSLEKFSFRFLGEYDKQSKYYKDFGNICEFEGHVTKEQLLHFCSETDILIFPSLADGFGLSVLEALSCGIPVICSENSGASDLIENGYNGFVIPAGSSQEIYDKLIWFENNRDMLMVMSENARKTAERYSWDKYDNQIKLAIESICK